MEQSSDLPAVADQRELEQDGPGQGSQVAPPGVWPVFTDARFSLLLRHWAEGRKGIATPRDAIDPAAIKSCLPHVYMFRFRAEDGSFICTLAGEKVSEAWGHAMIGRQPQDFMPAASAATALAIYRRIVTEPAVHVGHRPITPRVLPEKAADRLVVPLTWPDGRPWGMLGLSIYHYNPVTQAGHPPHVGPDVTYFPCVALPPDLPPAP
ncbi:PAS domain-containing protein [Ferrovibrio sp.]|uniref:PAS domain-containing protein n=1 Tax=Ferrovibrio sp. TaxID=1917215 RepID=UPI0035B32340